MKLPVCTFVQFILGSELRRAVKHQTLEVLEVMETSHGGFCVGCREGCAVED